MRLTASGGLGGPRRFQARRADHRRPRRTLRLLGLVFGVPVVAAAVVLSGTGTPAPAAGGIAGHDPATSGAVSREAAAAAASTPAGARVTAAPGSVAAGAPRAALSRGSVDPADLIAGAPAGPGDGPDGDMPGAPGVAAQPPAASRPPSAEPEELTGYVWPLRGARIHGWFEPSDEGFIVLRSKRIHDGLDLATFCGHQVVAAHAGTVLHAGRGFHPYLGFDGPMDRFYEKLRARGEWRTLPRVVVIDDGNGYHSAYVHLGSHNVKAGDVVEAGDVIGKEGATGRASGCHLHYMLIRMDGPFVPVAPKLVKQWHYPARVRERIDPIRVLDFDSKWAARRVPGVDPPEVPYRYQPSVRRPVFDDVAR